GLISGGSFNSYLQLQVRRGSELGDDFGVERCPFAMRYYTAPSDRSAPTILFLGLLISGHHMHRSLRLKASGLRFNYISARGVASHEHAFVGDRATGRGPFYVPDRICLPVLIEAAHLERDVLSRANLYTRRIENYPVQPRRLNKLL